MLQLLREISNTICFFKLAYLKNSSEIQKKSVEASQNTKNKTTVWLSWVYIRKKPQNTNFKRYMHPMFTAALFTIAKMWK